MRIIKKLGKNRTAILTILFVGGTPDTQRDFLESLASSESRRNFDRQKIPPIANSFALGYTYFDVLDADQDGKQLLFGLHSYQLD